MEKTKFPYRDVSLLLVGFGIACIIPLSDFLFTPEHISLSEQGVFSQFLRIIIAFLVAFFLYKKYKINEKYKDLEDLGKKNESIIKLQNGRIIKIK